MSDDPLMTGDPFLDGFLWSRAVMESRASVRATVSSRPFPLIDQLASLAEAKDLETDFEEVGATAEHDGSLAMKFKAKDDWTFTALRDPIGARTVSGKFSTEFLQGFFAGRCSMSGALYCSWNRAAPDIVETMNELGVDHVVEHDTVRVRAAAKHPEFAGFIQARKEERAAMAEMATEVEKEEQADITEGGWLYWDELEDEEQANYQLIVQALQFGPASFGQVQSFLEDQFDNDVQFRIAMGRAIKTTEQPDGTPTIRKIYPRLLEGAFRMADRRYPKSGFTPVYVLHPTHNTAMECFGVLAANMEHVDSGDQELLWQSLQTSAIKVFPPDEAANLDWDAMRWLWSQNKVHGPDWSLVGSHPAMMPAIAHEGDEHGQSALDFAAALMGPLGHLDSAGFRVNTDQLTPMVLRLLEWVEAQSQVPAKLAINEAGANRKLEGILSLPVRMQDVLQLGPDGMQRNPHYQTGMSFLWILSENEPTLPDPYQMILEEELQRPERRSSLAGYMPKWLKEKSNA